MNKFLKLTIIPIAFLVSGSLASCSAPEKEIALITDVGDIDDGSFNQESWEAVKEYATKNHKSFDFYRPFNDSDFARNCAVKQAVAKGAQVIVLPGFKFAPTCAAMMGKFPKVNFLLIDSTIHNGNYVPIKPTKNACCVGFKCEYSGFIAGYSVAQDLMTRDWNESKTNGTPHLKNYYGYGYAGGMATSGVYEFGYGYIQGICQATSDFCKKHEITDPKDMPTIRVNYTYAGVFAQDNPTAIKVKSWYSASGKDNVKVVFPCGGKLYQSITEAAQFYNKHQKFYNSWMKSEGSAPRDAARWVGVDSDQYRGLKYNYDQKSIYTSALKGLNHAIINSLAFHYAGAWDKIGGPHGEQGTGYVTGGGYVQDYKWVLGLNSVFGEFESEEESKPYRDDYVGIPTECDKKTNVMRGFDNFTKDDYQTIYNRLIIGDTATVYAGNAAEDYKWSGGTIQSGYPDGMTEWELKEGAGKSFREQFLGNYPKDKIINIKTV